MPNTWSLHNGDKKQLLLTKIATSSGDVFLIADALMGENRAAASVLAKEIQRSQRYQHFVSLVILKVDRPVHAGNHGRTHAKRLSRLIRRSVRNVDVVARLRDGQFAVILPETSKDDAITLAVRLRRRMEWYALRPGKDEKRKGSVHAAIVCYPVNGYSPEELLAKAAIVLEQGGG